jgi:hypothetical protein
MPTNVASVVGFMQVSSAVNVSSRLNRIMHIPVQDNAPTLNKDSVARVVKRIVLFRKMSQACQALSGHSPHPLYILELLMGCVAEIYGPVSPVAESRVVHKYP